MLCLGISFGVVFIDQLTKWFSLKYLSFEHSIAIIPGFFDLSLVFNSGAAFGILKGKKILLIFLTGISLIVIHHLYRLYAKKNRWLKISLGLIIGGAIGNLIDRFRYGYVIDFLDFYIKQSHWPAFNVADTSITIGMTIFSIIFIFYSKQKEHPLNHVA